MSFESIEGPGIFIAGIAVRTTNQDGKSEADIGGLWTKFTTENMAGQIEGKLSDDKLSGIWSIDDVKVPLTFERANPAPSK